MNNRTYWQDNLRLVGICLALWFLVSFGFGILLRDWLDQLEIGAFRADPRIGEQVADQLLQNLIGNAIKFEGGKTPEIHVGATRDGDSWVFSVKDNGIGIEPQYAERIFLIFQRLHGAGEYAGTGIGLAVCKKIVERHGGKIRLESEPGQGTTFYFTLPAHGKNQ